MGWVLEQGDCLEVLRNSALIADNSMDSMVSDPPSGTGFMGRDWDCFRRRHNPADVGRPSVHGRMSAHAPHSYGESERGNFIAFMTEAMRESLRVLKPGAYALVWALPRTSHWTATAMEDAGFEIRDVVTHHFGSGFPKSQDVGKFMDKLAGAEREEVGRRKEGSGWKAQDKFNQQLGFRPNAYLQDRTEVVYTAPATDEAKQWDDWGTALKPATEHWILARKPLSESSIARNVLKHGTGALNIGACRVERDAGDVPGWHTSGAKGSEGYRSEKCPDCVGGVYCLTCKGTGWLKGTFIIRDMSAEEIQGRCGDKGRWPTNLLLSHSEACEEGQCALDCPVAGINEQSSGASRFFPTFHYFPKPSRSEREAGLESLPNRTLNRVNPGGLENEPRFAPIEVKNNHPTVKGRKLMTWLIKLITPPGGWVLDPFAGSGSTGVAAMAGGFNFFGVEKEAEYIQIAEKRIEFAIAERMGQMTLEELEEDFG